MGHVRSGLKPDLASALLELSVVAVCRVVSVLPPQSGYTNGGVSPNMQTHTCARLPARPCCGASLIAGARMQTGNFDPCGRVWQNGPVQRVSLPLTQWLLGWTPALPTLIGKTVTANSKWMD